MKNEITIGTDKIGDGHPVYFIADIAANHDGDLQRAKLLTRTPEVFCWTWSCA